MNAKRLCLPLLIACAAVLRADDAMTGFQMPDVPLPNIPDRSASIADFGAVPDGKTLNSDAIAKAISSLAEKGGGRVVFPPGMWVTGPIGLKSNIELHLEAGALVVFQPDFALYPSLNYDAKGVPRSVTTSPIHGEGLENIAITGQGVFDGSGQAWRMIKKSKMTDAQWKQLVATTNSVTDGETWYPSREAMSARRPNLLKLADCRRILLEGVTFQNSPGWNLNPTLCEDLTIRNVNVKNEWWAQNGDGLDIENCRNVIVRGSRFDVGDDGICLKSGSNAEGRRLAAPTENILIEDCTVYHAHGGVTIGSEMSSGVRNVRVNNCLFLGTDLGLRFKSTRGRGGVVEKIYISNVRMEDIATDAIGFNMFYGGQSPADEGNAGADESPAIPVGVGTPQFRDIYIQDVICRGAATAVALQGLPEMPIRGIHLRNVSITAARGVALLDAQDITFNHVEIRNAGGPVMTLAGSHDISIDELAYPSGAEAVFQAQGTNNSNITVAQTDLKTAAQDVLLSRGATRDVFNIH